MLGIHYYLWYGRPFFPVIGAGNWRTGRSHQPVLGDYDSRDPAVIDRHIGWAKEAGIDFFIVNWNDAGSWDDITLKNHYLTHPKSREMKFCLQYDGSLALNVFRNPTSFDFNGDYSPGKQKGKKLLEDFEYLAENYFNHPCYLKINNRPAVFIYGASAFRNVTETFEILKNNMERRNISLYLIADAVHWAGVNPTRKNLSYLWEISPQQLSKMFSQAMRRFSLNNLQKDVSLSKYFGAMTGYNMYSPNRTANFLENIDKVYNKFYNYSVLQNLRFIPTIIPGYDDRHMKGLGRPILDRNEGKFYQEFWRTAKKYIDPSLKMAVITTFNEWHEGTEIEPSKEYGEKYIQLTKSFALDLKK